MNKLLSIIVPSYNMEQYLPKCLGSLIVDDAALLSRLDVIVVNDGSKDRTSEIAHGFEAKYPGVFRVIDKANGNYGSCINAALMVAEGRFVKILDADDTYDTVAFGKYLRQIEALPSDTDMVMNDYVEVDETGAETKTVAYDLPTGKWFDVLKLVEGNCPMAMHAVAFRTGLLREINYTQLEGISYTDTEWYYLPAGFSQKVSYLPLPVYRYLLGRSGQTMEKDSWLKNRWMMDRIFERMLGQYDEVSCGASTRRYLEFQLRRMYSLVMYLHNDESLREQLPVFYRKLQPLVAKHPYLRYLVRGPVLFSRLPIRFHYLHFVIRHPALTWPMLSFVSWYNAIRAKI